MLVSDPTSLPHCDNTQRNGTDNAFSGSLRHTYARLPLLVRRFFNRLSKGGEKHVYTA